MKSSKTPCKASKTSRKLSSTTPRKKADRTIYAPSLDTTARDAYVNETQHTETDCKTLPAVTQSSTEKPRDPVSIEKKKPTITATRPTVVQKEKSPPPNVDAIDLLNCIDMTLFGASWFVFGMLAVWFVLQLVQPPLAFTLQAKVLDIFDLVTNSYGNYFVVEISYFVLTLLAFHFALTLIMSLVDEQK